MKKKSILWRSKSRLIELPPRSVMGIINLTDDSFWAGSRVSGEAALLDRVRSMIDLGADIIDMGAASSRPGSTPPKVEEERDKAVMAIQLVRKHFPHVLISLDTYRSEVAAYGLEAGADIINDISGFSIDPDILKIVAQYRVPYILMHMRGTPATMQEHTEYGHLLEEIYQYFTDKIAVLKAHGIWDIAIDPGFGFAKTLDQNYQLLAHLGLFNSLGYPLLTGISRKSMITKFLGISAADALSATSALHWYALSQGSAILRVHDVREAKQVVAMFEKIEGILA